MKRILLPLFLVLQCPLALAGPSLETVLGVLRQQTVAANRGDIATILKTVPDKGVIITHPTGETATLDRKMMETYLAGYFKSMKPDSYVYGTRLRSVDAQDDSSITVMLEVSESYVLAENNASMNSWYREKLTVGFENGKPVFLKAAMEKPEIGKIEGAAAKKDP